MKKLLLLMGGALLSCATVASAQDSEPAQKIVGAMLSHVSPSGEWAVSSGDNNFAVYNLKTGAVYTIAASEDDSYDLNYQAGYGNCVSDNGIVVGGSTYSAGAGYFHITPEAPDGEWVALDVLNTSTNCAHAITPDGSRIIGTSAAVGSNYNVDMVYSVPLLWQRNDEGTYDMIELPYPTLDFTGKRMPQYVIGLGISNDGKRLLAQVTDYAGYMHTLLVYNEQEDGSWAYEYVHPELQNMGAEFPEWEAQPESPKYSDFMSDDEYAEYYAAYYDYIYGDGTDYPIATNYMSEEELAAYNAAKEEYNAAYSEWYEKSEAFYDVYWGLIDAGAPDFLMNSVFMSDNGVHVAASKAEGDYFSGYTYSPYYFNLETGDYKAYVFESDDEGDVEEGDDDDDDDEFGDDNFGVGGSDSSSSLSICANFVSNNGDMLGGQTCADGYLRLAWAKAADSDEWVRLHDYIATRSEEAAEWMEIQLPGSVITGYTFDEDTWETTYIYEDTLIDGMPTANADMTVLTSWVYNYLAEEEDDFEYSIVLNLPETSGIKGVTAATDKTFGVKAARNGVINITGDAKTLEVFDLTGKTVYRNDAPAASVSTGLNAGIYLVKATAANGKTAIVKAAFTE
jgi:hypothetical protein